MSGCFQEQELTHESTEGDDGQQPLDQNPEPVSQSSVIAAVRVRFVDLRHVGDFKNIPVQKPFLQEQPAEQIHGTIKKQRRWRQKEHNTATLLLISTEKTQRFTSGDRLM